MEKAQLFAEAFAAKFVLPSDLGDIEVEEPVAIMHEWVPIRRRWAAQILKHRLDQAIGPDYLPARILQACWQELSLPITKLTRKLLDDGVWPNEWKSHWLSPLFKRGAVFNPEKYRGLNLTPVLSKVVERCVGSVLVPFLEAANAYGES